MGAFGENGPKVLLICPPPLGPIENGCFAEMFKGGVEKSKDMGKYFATVAGNFGVEFLDAGTIIHSSNEDGVHLQADQHAILGKEVGAIVKKILEG